MSGTSTIDLTGTVEVTTNRKSTAISLSQTIDALEVKTLEATIPHGTVSPLAVPLGLSSGVPEALVLHVMAPRTVGMRITGNGATPGPTLLQVKGYQMLTFAPGGGLTALAFTNENGTEDVVVEYVVGAKAQTDDDAPTFWDDATVA